MTDLPSLITRLREADGPDIELDAEIDILLFGGETIWKTANGTMEQYPASRRPSKHHVGGFANEYVPRVTSSLDAVAALAERLLPGWVWTVDGPNPYGRASITDPEDYLVPCYIARHGHVPAIALLIATLTAWGERQ